MTMPKILLVEDDHAIANLYKTKLEYSDYDVSVAFNGLEGLKAIALALPEIILLDLKMPIMSGEEFLRKFRKNLDYQDIPVIVLTNISREEAPKTLWHYGISGYFVKAHNTPSDLVKIIEKILSKT
jgi:DNA-binding response OmpR family regulator